MAISYIGASSALVAGSSGTTTTFSNAFTAATSGTNRKLVVVFATKENSESITSVSYNGQALTEAIKAVQTGSNPDSEIYIYYLDHGAIPTDGAAHDLVIVSSNSMNPLALILEYAGVAQGAPSQTDTDLPTGGAAGTCSFTSVVDGSLIVVGANNAGATVAFTPGGGTTELSDADQTGTPQFSFTVAHIVGTSGATFDLTEDPSGTADTGMCAALWAAAAEATPTSMPPPPRTPAMMSLLVR